MVSVTASTSSPVAALDTMTDTIRTGIAANGGVELHGGGTIRGVGKEGSTRARAWIVVVSAVIALAGCTDSERSVHPTTTTTTTTSPSPSPSILGPLGKPGCKPASPFSSMELQGTPGEPGTSLYGLAFLQAGESFAVGVEVKVVWRMTGKGDLKVRLIDPAGRPKALAWGPEVHSGSTYHRPGDEWGTGFTLDQPGCWEIRFSRDTSHASVWIDATA
jgi:hypothetical protein